MPLCSNLEKDLRVPLGDLQQLLGRAGRLPAPLLPLFQGALGHSKGGGELGLRQTTLHPHASHLRLGFDLGAPSPAAFDLPHSVQDLLPHVALGLELGKRCTIELPIRLPQLAKEP